MPCVFFWGLQGLCMNCFKMFQESLALVGFQGFPKFSLLGPLGLSICFSAFQGFTLGVAWF